VILWQEEKQIGEEEGVWNVMEGRGISGIIISSHESEPFLVASSVSLIHVYYMYISGLQQRQ